MDFLKRCVPGQADADGGQPVRLHFPGDEPGYRKERGFFPGASGDVGRRRMPSAGERVPQRRRFPAGP